VAVFFALLLPLLLTLLALTLNVGNWYVHKRNLQTLADAAAFAGATQFQACFDDPSAANGAIADTALDYAGDTSREPATLNRQVQEPGDVHVLLNSSGYWPAGVENNLGDPCSTLFLDVKATDDSVPDITRWLPFSPSVKAHARVEIRKTLAMEDVMPWAVPWIEPERVAVLFVDENFSPPTVIDFQELISANDLSLPYSEWVTSTGQEDVASSSENIGVVVVVAKVEPASGLSLSGPLADICGQDPGNVVCYGQTTPLGFVQRYDDDTAASSTAPVIREVRLELAGSQSPNNLNCFSNPGAPYYFLDMGCRIVMRAVVDFGITGDPRGDPTASPPGVKARVELAGGGQLQWSTGGLGGTLGTWSATITLPDSAPGGLGRQMYGLRLWTLDTERTASNDANVAAPYVFTSESGPVEYLELTHVTTGLSGNSVPDEPTNPIAVTVGLRPPLERYQKNILRVASQSGERTQALDCDSVTGEPSAGPLLAEEIENGCQTPLALNYDVSTSTWRDYDCWDYNPANNTPSFRYTLPVVGPPSSPDPIPDCVRTETGARPDGVDGVRMGMHNRFEGPSDTLCTANNWPDQPGETQYPPDDDPRWVVLVITDWTKLEGIGQSPEDSVPIRTFGSFYVTGWTVWPEDGSETTGCPGLPIGKRNEPRPPGVRKNGGDVWGYFKEFVEPPSDGTPSEEMCAAGVEPCIAVLVE
jgi:hypothetical protein